MPPKLKKKIGQYGGIPATLLGRLATASKYQRKQELRIEETLLAESSFNAWCREIELNDRERIPSANAAELLSSGPAPPKNAFVSLSSRLPLEL